MMVGGDMGMMHNKRGDTTTTTPNGKNNLQHAVRLARLKKALSRWQEEEAAGNDWEDMRWTDDRPLSVNPHTRGSQWDVVPAGQRSIEVEDWIKAEEKEIEDEQWVWGDGPRTTQTVTRKVKVQATNVPVGYTAVPVPETHKTEVEVDVNVIQSSAAGVPHPQGTTEVKVEVNVPDAEVHVPVPDKTTDHTPDILPPAPAPVPEPSQTTIDYTEVTQEVIFKQPHKIVTQEVYVHQPQKVVTQEVIFHQPHTVVTQDVYVHQPHKTVTQEVIFKQPHKTVTQEIRVKPQEIVTVTEEILVTPHASPKKVVEVVREEQIIDPLYAPSEPYEEVIIHEKQTKPRVQVVVEEEEVVTKPVGQAYRVEPLQATKVHHPEVYYYTPEPYVQVFVEEIEVAESHPAQYHQKGGVYPTHYQQKESLRSSHRQSKEVTYHSTPDQHDEDHSSHHLQNEISYHSTPDHQDESVEHEEEHIHEDYGYGSHREHEVGYNGDEYGQHYHCKALPCGQREYRPVGHYVEVVEVWDEGAGEWTEVWEDK